jgi:hypothetical protein
VLPNRKSKPRDTLPIGFPIRGWFLHTGFPLGNAVVGLPPSTGWKVLSISGGGADEPFQAK